MFLWIASGLSVFIILLSYILKWRKGRNIAHLPTYTYLPIFGTMYKLIGGSTALHSEVYKMSKICDRTNLPFVYWAGTTPIFVMQDPDDLKLVTNEFVEKPYIYNFAKIYFGDCVATAPGHIWKHDVKGFVQALRHKSVRTYQDVFNSQAKKLVNALKSGATKDIFAKLTHNTFETICIICTGSEIPDLIPIHDYHEAASGILSKLISRALNVLHHPEFVYKCTRSYRELLKYNEVLRGVSEKILKKYQQNSIKQKSEHDKCEKTGSSKYSFKPFLSYFEEMGLTEEKIKSEIDILAFAQDPVAIALLMIFFLLGTRQDIQDKLLKEVKEIFGDSKRDVTREDTEKMVYCEGVIREALRLYPPGPIALRNVDREFQIKSCTIPKDSICLINMWGSGRSWRLWGPDVLEFRPERWLEPDSPLPPVFAFSVGKRACVGEKYAYTILKTMVAHAVRELVFEADISKLKIKIDLVLRVYEGLDTLKISRRPAAAEQTKDA